MSGEIEGIAVIVNLDAAPVGFGDLTITRGGEVVDITNRSHGGNITLLNNAMSNNQYTLSGPLFFETSGQYEQLDLARTTGAHQAITVTYAATGKELDGTFAVTGFEETGPLAGALSATVTLASSGAVARTPITTVP